MCVPGSFYLFFLGKVKENYWNLLHTHITQPKKKRFRGGELYMPDVYKARLHYYLLWITFTVYNSYMRCSSSSCSLSCLCACVRAGLPSLSFMLRKIFLYSVSKTFFGCFVQITAAFLSSLPPVFFFFFWISFFLSTTDTFPRSQRNFLFLGAS